MSRSQSTLFLSSSDFCRLISLVGLCEFTKQLSDRIEKDFIRWPEFQKCSRTANHSPGGVIELMPASDGKYFSFKYVTGHPSNVRIGLATIMGFGALSEVETGWPLMISEMTMLTAIRTAATSAVAAMALADPHATAMAMIGNGAQSEFQILAFHRLLSINEFHLYDLDPAATQKLIANLGGMAGLELVHHRTAASAVEQSQIVTTATANKALALILTPEMIQPGMHINAVGGDCPGKTELHPNIIERSKVFVEFEAQTRIEGEIQQMPPTFPVTELWEVLSARKPGRISAADITVFDSVGFSIEDFSALTLTYELAQAFGIGSKIDLIPDLADTKNLYGHLSPS